MYRGVTNSTSGGYSNKPYEFLDPILLFNFFEIFQLALTIWNLLTFYYIFVCNCTENAPGRHYFHSGGDKSGLAEFLDPILLFNVFKIFQLRLTV